MAVQSRKGNHWAFESSAGFVGYLPRDIFNLNTPYGSPDKLKILIEKMHTRGLLAIADIVINHRCAFQQSSDGKWNRFGGESGKATWDPSAITCSNPEWGGRGGPKQGDEYPAAPNIDHNQDFVVRDYTEWLKWLQSDVGFDGWRLDYVRGVPGNFMRRYIEATEPLMALGEFWDRRGAKAMTESFDKLYGGETKLSDETLNQLENDVAAFELTRATEVDEAHGRPPDLAETEAC
ncbi:hypothetical protein FOA52_015559 [Chlamydomonas sp. UWO 241]|nr:hypothetical protein FOA52_015559 [Chlamydomonas sp. UWO 241]